MTITILPCHFCGHDDVELDEVDMRCFAVCCPECEAIGPASRKSVEHAIALWNQPHDKSLKMDRLVREARDGYGAAVRAPGAGLCRRLRGECLH